MSALGEDWAMWGGRGDRNMASNAKDLPSDFGPGVRKSHQTVEVIVHAFLLVLQIGDGPGDIFGHGFGHAALMGLLKLGAPSLSKRFKHWPVANAPASFNASCTWVSQSSIVFPGLNVTLTVIESSELHMILAGTLLELYVILKKYRS